jgi:hypothetical protein
MNPGGSILLADVGPFWSPITNCVRAGRKGRTTTVSNTSRWLRLVLSLLVFPPVFALLGAFTTLDSGKPLGRGLTIGLLVGVCFALIFGGVKGRWLDAVLGPDEGIEGEDEKRLVPSSPDVERGARTQFRVGNRATETDAVKEYGEGRAGRTRRPF